MEKVYQNAVFDAIVNRNYEGDIKRPGDRVNVLSFLNAGEINDYTVGTDMVVGQIVDAQDQLVVEKRKYYNFSIDRLEEQFTYGIDLVDKIILEHAKILERVIDTYVLNVAASAAKAGSWIGTNFLVVGAANTMASLVTSATGGTITVSMDNTIIEGSAVVGSTENPLDGIVYFGGFQTTDLFKGIRLSSTRAFVTPWWRITSITDSATVAVTEWDAATSGPDFEEGYTLRGTWGGTNPNSFVKYGETADASLVATSGLGWEVQAAIATALSASSIYPQCVLLNEALDANEIPAEGRKLVLPPAGITLLRRAAELQPTGIAEIYSGVVLNGKVARFASFDVFSAAGARISTRASRSTATGAGSSTVLTTGTTGYQIVACTQQFVTYGDKWSESRVMEAVNQFSKQYQGLYLFGAVVPAGHRKFGAVLLGSV